MAKIGCISKPFSSLTRIRIMKTHYKGIGSERAFSNPVFDKINPV